MYCTRTTPYVGKWTCWRLESGVLGSSSDRIDRSTAGATVRSGVPCPRAQGHWVDNQPPSLEAWALCLGPRDTHGHLEWGRLPR